MDPKNSQDLLETLNSRLLSDYNSIKTYDCSTLHTSIPDTLLKSRVKNTIRSCFQKKQKTKNKRKVHLDIII